jgi:ubiquinone/menaquinone biosynthesis C-methylase UbiE
LIPASSQPADAVYFHSQIASAFHASYQSDPNRLERVRIWSSFLDRYARDAKFAYDIGCGSGVLACEMARRGIETVGVDGAEGMLEIARQTASNAKLKNVSFQQHRLPLGDTSAFQQADVVICSSVLEYLESFPEGLSCLRRLLKEQGVVMFSVSNRDSISRRLVRWAHRLTGRPRYFGLLRHFMSIEDVMHELRIAELAYEEHAYFGRADRINRLLSVFLPPRYSSNMLLVIARKKR